MRKCSRCHKIKSVDCFYRRKDRRGQYQSHCLECDKFRTRESRAKVRRTLVHHYSGGTNACAICAESRFAVLDLDHTHGGGIKDRASHKTIHQYYMRLIRQGFPEGYRILCRNCNWIEWIKRKDKNNER